MAETQTSPDIDPISGFSPSTKTFHSIGPRVTLSLPTEPLSVTAFAFHLLHTSPDNPFLIDSVSGIAIDYKTFIQKTDSLASSLRLSLPSLSRNNVALVLSPPSLSVPLLYFSLLSLGITVCPVNPLTTPSELTRMIKIANPVVAFTISSLSRKISNNNIPVVLLDSPEFKAMTSSLGDDTKKMKVEQSDRAAILFSSGTTGQVKGVEITHRNLIATLARFHHDREKSVAAGYTPHLRRLFSIPLFHVFGFTWLIGAAAMGETLVIVTERVELEGILKLVERFNVSSFPTTPPLVVAMGKSPVVERYDLRTLRVVTCGGAPLGEDTMKVFASRFPAVQIVQGYGLTEAGAVTRISEPNGTIRFTSVGRLADNFEAKIVDHITGEALSFNQRGELWLRGPTIMRGYVGDDEATAATLDRDGWLKTGDLCYIDSDGFLYVVDRLKELIKYKAYQVPPAELEHILHEYPEIVDAAVVPYPDEEAGQIPMAFIVKKPDSNITATQVIDFIAKRVSPYKKIRRVAFINAIPKSPAGKILRRELVNLAVSGASSKL